MLLRIGRSLKLQGNVGLAYGCPAEGDAFRLQIQRQWIDLILSETCEMQQDLKVR
jgi:hypothetical protein